MNCIHVALYHLEHGVQFPRHALVTIARYDLPSCQLETCLKFFEVGVRKAATRPNWWIAVGLVVLGPRTLVLSRGDIRYLGSLCIALLFPSIFPSYSVDSPKPTICYIIEMLET